MKVAVVVVFTLLLTGCASSRQSVSLAAEQAKALAMDLANDKAATLYSCRPFNDGKPAQFTSGHWLWYERKGCGRGDIEAVVELSADGSTNRVVVQMLDNMINGVSSRTP